MTTLLLAALICGPIPRGNMMNDAVTKNCYKTFLLCVERKERAGMKEDKSIEACILEM